MWVYITVIQRGETHTHIIPFKKKERQEENNKEKIHSKENQ